MMTQKTLSSIIPKGITFLLFVLLCLSFFTFPLPKMINLDTSWQMILGHAFKQNWQMGVDYIFTFGFLGYFFVKNPIYDADLFYQTVAWVIIFNCLFSVVFLVRWHQLHDWMEKSLFLLLSAVVMTGLSFFNDSLYFLAIVCTTILMIHPPQFLSKKGYFPVLGLVLFSFAILSLTKFTVFILVMFCITSISIVLWQKYSFKTAAKTLIIFMIMLMGIWILCQQSLLNIPTFITTSLEMARGYSEAMSIEPNIFLVWWAICGITVTSILVIFNCLIQPRELGQFISGGIILLTLFLSWKAGFVRADVIHVITFFCVAMIVPFLIVRSQNMGFKNSIIFSVLLFLSVFIALTGAFYTVQTIPGYSARHIFLSKWPNTIVNNAKTLSSLNQVKSSYNLITSDLRKKYELPNIRATVGNATIDMFSHGQGILLLNGLNYHPRPIFQGYAAFGDSLLKINGDFYANSQTAPEFILFGLSEIDQRLPSIEDSQTLKVILDHYKPLLIEKGVLLLKRAVEKQTVFTDKNTILTKEISIGESFSLQEINNQPLFLNIDIRKNLLGHFTKTFYQLPPLFLEVKTTQGQTIVRRIASNLSQADFLINPLLFDQIDLVKWYQDEPLKQVESLRVIVKSPWLLYLFNLKITVTVKK